LRSAQTADFVFRLQRTRIARMSVVLGGSSIRGFRVVASVAAPLEDDGEVRLDEGGEEDRPERAVSGACCLLFQLISE